ncbi:TRAP transporter small permease [Vreelandella neptunia]|jgi:TRAP-type C4-dicarboxylate transport system permease small subunit|uniref:TRAP transporter small permease n=1 Tax=Vreelandella neptunia TaxID=115551 RepID=UPI000C0D08C4|nr:TRAP transporter small permease [Halomonas sp.]MBL1266489.1 TRAP transporter small permease [Halomonas sp.]
MTRIVLRRLAIAMAMAGGVLLLSAIGISLLSMLGRRLWSAPISGDIELLQMLIAVAVACFLPLCEINDRHIRVDIVGTFLPALFNRVLLAIAHLVLALVSGLLVWRTALLALDSLTYNAQSVQLGIPQWIPQAAMLPGIAMLGLCALYQGICCVAHDVETAASEGDSL